MKGSTVLAVLTALSLSGCGDDPTGPIPPAQLTFYGRMTWTICLAGFCPGMAEGRNVGQGCASDISGVLRLFDADDVEVTVAAWDYPEKVHPGEPFVYQVALIPIAATRVATRYETEATWTNVRC